MGNNLNRTVFRKEQQLDESGGVKYDEYAISLMCVKTVLRPAARSVL